MIFLTSKFSLGMLHQTTLENNGYLLSVQPMNREVVRDTLIDPCRRGENKLAIVDTLQDYKEHGYFILDDIGIDFGYTVVHRISLRGYDTLLVAGCHNPSGKALLARYYSVSYPSGMIPLLCE